MGGKVGLVLAVLLFLQSCAEVVTSSKLELSEKETYAVLPFENYTETPLAGYRVASIAEGILRSKGLKVVRVWRYADREPTGEEMEKLRKEALKKARYLIYGNEFRYKAGIDGEPAVSISLFLYDAKEGKVVKGSSASATGWSYESVGTVAHELLKKLLK